MNAIKGKENELVAESEEDARKRADAHAMFQVELNKTKLWISFILQ
jgi:hypothetical protein